MAQFQLVFEEAKICLSDPALKQGAEPNLVIYSSPVFLSQVCAAANVWIGNIFLSFIRYASGLSSHFWFELAFGQLFLSVRAVVVMSEEFVASSSAAMFHLVLTHTLTHAQANPSVCLRLLALIKGLHIRPLCCCCGAVLLAP